MNLEFYRCDVCGNIVVYLNKSGVKVMCCGQEMTKMEPNSTDAANEKHVPVAEVNGKNVKVSVGSVLHPMLEEHSIQWVVLETNKGYYKRDLEVGKEPIANFTMQDDEEMVNVYEYCNLHGLWSIK